MQGASDSESDMADTVCAFRESKALESLTLSSNLLGEEPEDL